MIETHFHCGFYMQLNNKIMISWEEIFGEKKSTHVGKGHEQCGKGPNSPSKWWFLGIVIATT